MPAPTNLPCYENINHLPTEDLNNWSLLPQKPNWAKGFEPLWKAGEKEALKKFANFLDSKVFEYHKNRDRPDLEGTSRLSPHLKFGEISPRLIWHQINERIITDLPAERGAHVFLSEIGWREFAHYLLFHNPNMLDEEIKPGFRHFPWKGSTASLKQWQKGQTGYPIVDAAMRQLWHTGWMHSRCRMIVASFLVKHLLIDWRLGAKWFMDTLLDADEASNSMNWQWVAGCGVDASPYFRIFNPVLQGGKFDPNGDYVRKWIPELSKLSNKFIHSPWEAPEQDLQVANIKMGTTYPNPIVDHAAARIRALGAYKQLKEV